jgi:hypothetical protein
MLATAVRTSLISSLALFAVLACATDQPKARQWVLYRPATSTFYIKQDGDNKPVAALQFGAAGDVPLWADFTGDGKGEPGLYRKGQWLISTHADAKVDLTVNFGGQAGDIPLAADVDGDGRADLVVFRAGEWDVRSTRNPAITQIFHFGAAGDIPLLADFDGDGKIDFAVFRGGQWYVDTHRNGKADLTFAFGGVANERPLASSWNSSGPAALILFRDGDWFVSAQRDGKLSAQTAFGTKGDIPVAVGQPR